MPTTSLSLRRATWTGLALAAIAALPAPARAATAPATKPDAVLAGKAAQAKPPPPSDAQLLASATAGVFTPPQGAATAGAPARPLEASRPPRRHRMLGLQLDGGAPDLAAAGLVFRPWRWMRVSGSALYNSAGFGGRAGLTLAPAWIVAPSITIEGGRYVETNLHSAVARFATVDAEMDPLLRKFGYTFANAQLGLEIGHPNAFVFFVRAGLSRMWLTAHGVQEAATSSMDDPTTVVTAIDDPRIRLGIPSAKVGFLVYLY